ncbi:MAG: ribbon-helix-helix domain-containing protein [Bifidobacteriaceae bacterium]|nr:ribbon-helix-helix domain-containing protein [Bifidobacteriaceae bacterium]
MTVRLDDDIHDALDAAAVRTGRSKNRLVNEALRQALASAEADSSQHNWRSPARGRWRPVPDHLLVHGDFTASELIDEQREECGQHQS